MDKEEKKEIRLKARIVKKTLPVPMNQRQDPKHCFYCGRLYTYDNLNTIRSKDHILPRCKNGNSSIYNILFSCRECNTFKGEMTPVEFKQNINSEYFTRTGTTSHFFHQRIDELIVYYNEHINLLDRKYEFWKYYLNM